MPLRNLDALFEPRSIGIIAESFAPGTHGALALQALASAKSPVPVVLVGPAPPQAPLPAVSSLAEFEEAPVLALITLQIGDAPTRVAALVEGVARAVVLA